MSKRPRTPASDLRPITNRSAFSSAASWATTFETSPVSTRSTARAAGRLLQVLEGASGFAARLLSPAARHDVDESKLGLIFLGQVTGPIQHAGAARFQIHSAQNPLARHRFQGGAFSR